MSEKQHSKLTAVTHNGTQHRWHYNLDPSLTTHSPNNPFSSRFLHPTSLTLARKDSKSDEEFLWTSRDHRKNRHVKYTPNQDKGKSRHGSSLLVGLGHMFRIEYWNVSWWVAIVSFRFPPRWDEFAYNILVLHPWFNHLGHQWVL